MPRELPIPPYVTAIVKHTEYLELSANVTVPAGSNTGSADITLPLSSVDIHSLRVYPPTGFTGTYTFELVDSAGNVIYRFKDNTGVLVDLAQVVVSDPNARLTAKITTSAPVSANTTFTVYVGISYVALS